MAPQHRKSLFVFVAVLVCALILVGVSTVSAGQEATPLTAANLALARMQELVEKKEVAQSWAVDFTGLQVSTRNIKGFREYVVQVNRISGEPTSMEFYFDMDGISTGDSR